uniref:NADH-ubiquinone oxidoreductase chain 5 n=1 Tax=Filhollianassa ceramica TaxID=2734693 RepID=A0A1B1VTY6_9EUCA|nr:NADH dehydrogenase subunit 5 [Filhollianassa ceramica]ANW37030.1 NADH dehydrogenase subunit 5 [Filhollianassa ceramica]
MLWKLCLSNSSMIFLSMFSMFNLLESFWLMLTNSAFVLEWELCTINSSFVEFVIILDWMSTLFLSCVSFISAMVLFYSKEYMAGHPHSERFLYLVLMFVLSMVLMISSPNLISILLGWDGLGLVSYILVIFYQNEKSSNAGMITILSNRVGDVAILIGITIMFHMGSWNFYHNVSLLEEEMVFLNMLVILAASTKSAQMPFSAWLPAAMAAPTPVSALVHSSTLVTAGVYLLIRFSPTLMNSMTQTTLLLISALTMFMAGLGANFEYDLKKIIALSTLSQLGVMISTLGLGYPVLAFFHLLTHALFKALLFLCAGVVIHNVKEYQDIRMMGSITKSMPLTMMCFNSANLALCGMPFLAGFYSKDLILELAFSSNINWVIWVLFTLATALTVSYSCRLFFLSLTSSFRLEPLSNLSDSASVMTSPMVALGLGSLMSGGTLMWTILPDPYLICMPTLLKMFPIFIITLSGLLGYMLVSYDFGGTLKRPVLIHFLGSMWFLPKLSGVTVGKPAFNIGNSLQSYMDKGWTEFLGAQGIYMNLSFSSKKLQSAQDNNIKVFLVSFFFWMAFIFILDL